MALNFPGSPTNGQQYQGFVYNSSVQAWQSNPASVAPFYTADLPPTNPTVGDSWFNTNDGTMYIYMYDGNTYQWVEHRSEIARSQVGLVPRVPTSINSASGTATVNALGVVTFTTSSAITLNNIFTSTYANYKLIISVAQTDSVEIRLRYAVAGTATASNYYYGAGRAAGNVFDNYSGTNSAQISLANGSSTGLTNISADIYRPAQAVTTGITYSGAALSSGYGINIFGGGNQQNATAFDGLYIYPATGTFTGTIQVFGYNN